MFDNRFLTDHKQELQKETIKQLEVRLKAAGLPTSAHQKDARVERLVQFEFAQYLAAGDDNYDQFTDQETRVLINLVHENKLNEATRDKKQRAKLWELVQAGIKQCRNCVWPVDKIVVSFYL